MSGLTPGGLLPPTPGRAADDAFMIPPGWDFDGTGVSPGGPDGIFAQMMAVGWDTTTGFGGTSTTSGDNR